MPTYAYTCKDCKSEFEVFHGIDDKQNCLQCNSENIQKVFKQKSVNIQINTTTARDRIEKFIEESRQTLKEQILETRKDYKP